LFWELRFLSPVESSRRRLKQRYRLAAAYASIVQEDLFSDFFAYRSMAKDVDASEETFVAPCLLPL
jgi:hypothetical protein